VAIFRLYRFHLAGLQHPRPAFHWFECAFKTRSRHPSRHPSIPGPIGLSLTTGLWAPGIIDAPETARYRQFVNVGSVQNLWRTFIANPGRFERRARCYKCRFSGNAFRFLFPGSVRTLRDCRGSRLPDPPRVACALRECASATGSARNRGRPSPRGPLNNSARSAFQSEQPQIVWCEPVTAAIAMSEGRDGRDVAFPVKRLRDGPLRGLRLACRDNLSWQSDSLIWNNQTALAQARPEPPAKHVPDHDPGTPSRPCRVIQRFPRASFG